MMLSMASESALGESECVEELEDIRLGMIISYYRWDLPETVRGGTVVKVGQRKPYIEVTDWELGSRENPRICRIDLYDVIIGCPIKASRRDVAERTLYRYWAD